MPSLPTVPLPLDRLEELAAPYYILKNKGYEVEIASIRGGKIPLDPASLDEDNLTEHSKNFLDDRKHPLP
jgi:putative intracellular protease/amidase